MYIHIFICEIPTFVRFCTRYLLNRCAKAVASVMEFTSTLFLIRLVDFDTQLSTFCYRGQLEIATAAETAYRLQACEVNENRRFKCKPRYHRQAI